MITIDRDGDGLKPQLRCVSCQAPLAVGEAWLAWRPPEDAGPAEGRWLHKRCLDGQAVMLFGARRVTLWRGADVLERLLREC